MPQVVTGRMPLGLSGDVIRTILFLVNLLFFVLAFFIFTFSLLIKLGHHARGDLVSADLLEGGLDIVMKTKTVDNATTFFMILSAIIMFFSMIGIYGTNRLEKIFLVSYNIIVLVLFLVHFILLLVLLYGYPSFQDHYKEGLNETITNLNNYKEFEVNCGLMKGFSAVFECCGSKGPMDFVNASVAIDCCEEDPGTGRTYQDGCGKKASKEFSTALNCLLIPSVFILLLELIVLTMVPFLIGRVQYYQYLP